MPRHFATDLGIKIKVDFNHLLKFMQGYSYENQKKTKGQWYVYREWRNHILQWQVNVERLTLQEAWRKNCVFGTF